MFTKFLIFVIRMYEAKCTATGTYTYGIETDPIGEIKIYNIPVTFTTIFRP